MSDQADASRRWMTWPTCRVDECVGVRPSEAFGECLRHLTEKDLEKVLDALHADESLDARGTQIDSALLRRLLDAFRTNDGNPAFRDALFEATEFIEDVAFDRVAFSGLASFDGARFNGIASFNEARFSSCSFSGAEFNQEAIFRSVHFLRPAAFLGAKFLKSANFNGARFSEANRLGPILARRRLLLDRTVFDESILIEAVTSELSCVQALFRQGTAMRVRWADIVLDGTAFVQPSTVSFAPPFRRARPAAAYGPVSVNWFFNETAFMKHRSEPRPKLISLRRVDVSNLVISDLDLSSCLFQGAQNLDRLSLEGPRRFPTTPRGLQLKRVRGQTTPVCLWTRRQTLAEEHQWRAPIIPPDRLDLDSAEAEGQRRYIDELLASQLESRAMAPKDGAWNPPSCRPPTGSRKRVIKRFKLLSPNT
jgi:uncharacterized protein YjbI with pentapeptide repeats